MANTFKKVIDRLMWAQVAPSPNVAAAGNAMCSDLRNDMSRNPFAYQLASNTVLNRFNIVTKAWNLVTNPSLAGAFGAGAAAVFAPSIGLRGQLAGGNTVSSVVVSSAFPAAVGANMLANRGGSGDLGFKIRIIGAASGKTEERNILGNTGGTTPTITLSAPLTFTPSNGDIYEIISGRVFMLGAGTTASGIWKSYETATNVLASALSTTNLPATIATDSALIALDEQYVPYNMQPGEGLVPGTFVYDSVNNLKALSATAVGANTLTGQATGGDAAIAANEYRNFQIRIVQDTVNPAAVGQRQIIVSHTGGPSPVYTINATWPGGTPSTSAKFVIENPNLILLRSSGQTALYVYNYSQLPTTNGTVAINSNEWSTGYAAGPAANAGGNVWAQSFGIQPDPARNARHSFQYFFRGGNAVTVDVFNLAGGTTGAWTSALTIDGAVAVNTGSCGCYAPNGSEGRMTYMNIYGSGLTSQIFRFDSQNRVLSPYAPTDFLQSGVAAAGNRITTYAAIDGSDVYDVVLLQSHFSNVTQELIALV